MSRGDRRKLAFDPIDEAARQWGLRWESVRAMHAATSIMRVQQILLADPRLVGGGPIPGARFGGGPVRGRSATTCGLSYIDCSLKLGRRGIE